MIKNNEDTDMFYKNISLKNIKGEIWKDLVWRDKLGYFDYTGVYQVSNYGRVKAIGSTFKGFYGEICYRPIKILKQSFDQCGYLMLGLSNAGKCQTKRVHILVAHLFVPNPENKPTVNHKYGIKTQNRPNQLEWATSKEQMKHAFRTGLSRGVVVNKQFKKLTPKDVLFIFNSTERPTYLSKKFGICRTGVHAILSGKIWNDVTGLASTRIRK